MNKRILVALLWMYAGWTLGALTATAAGLSPILGPVVAAGVLLLLVVAPRLGARSPR
jgi:hypothetical protein